MQSIMDASVVPWIMGNDFKTENGRALEFIRHRFLIDYLADDHPYKTTIKSSQVGLTVSEFLDDFHLVGKRHMNVIHTFHTSDILASVVEPKLNPLINNNPEIKAMVRNTDSHGLKRFNDNFLYLRGANSESQAISVTADVLKIDEKDRSNLSVVEMFHSRLDFSDYKWIREFSNPSMSGVGVDATWQKSNQYHWFVKCRACNHMMYLDFEPSEDRNHYVDRERRIYACGNCRRELTTADRIRGEWVPKWGKRDRIHGYWFSQLMAPWFTAGDICDKFEDSSADYFANFVLGKAYTQSDQKFDRETIMKAWQPGVPMLRNVVMGSDIGKPHWYWLGTPAGVFAMGKADSWDDLERLFLQYNCDAWVMDAQPEFTQVQKMLRKYPGRAFAAYFVRDTKNIGIIRWQEGDKRGTVHADRTKIIDRLVSEIGNANIRFMQPRADDLNQLIDHASNMYRVVETDSNSGVVKIEWRTVGADEGGSKKADHLVFAGVYWRIALEKAFSSGGGVVTTTPNHGKTLAPTVKDGKIQVSFDVEQSYKQAANRRIRS
jgi:hypothetical protein